MPERSSTSAEPAPRHARIADLLGPDGLARLGGAHVTVIGLGGVGSHAALALARGGVGRLTLIDFDPLTASNLNRHASGTPADVGRPKVDVVGDHLHRVAPGTRVERHQAFFHDDTADALLADRPGCVIDAIDSVTPKVALLSRCVGDDLPVISSMGASSRTDPSLVRVGPLSRSRGCPLAKAIRKRLRNRGVPLESITAVYSMEKAGAVLPPDEHEPSLRRGRTRNRLPSLPTLPGIFGYAAANAAILLLSGHG